MVWDSAGSASTIIDGSAGAPGRTSRSGLRPTQARILRPSGRADGVRRLATVLVAALAVAGCGHSGQNDAHIVWPGSSPDTAAGAAYPNTHPATPYTFGDVIICLDRPGNVVITGIDQVDPFGGMRIDDFAVIPNMMEWGLEGYDDNSVPIERLLPGHAGHVTMTNACPADIESPPPPTPSHDPPSSVALILQYG